MDERYFDNLDEIMKRDTELYFDEIDTLSKQDIDEVKEPFRIPELNSKNSFFNAFIKTGINAITARSGTGKSLVLVELALYFLHTDQADKVYYIDLDDNHKTLKDRKEARYIKSIPAGYIENIETMEAEFGERFKLYNQKRILETSKRNLKKCLEQAGELSAKYKAHALKGLANTIAKGEIETDISKLDDSTAAGRGWAILMDRIESLEKVVDYLDYGAITKQLKILPLKNSIIMLDSLTDFLDELDKNQIKRFFILLRDLNDAGATIFYLNHLTKGRETKNAAGSWKLSAKTDYPIILAKNSAGGINVEFQDEKSRYTSNACYSLIVNTDADLGERIFKTEFVSDIDGFTDAQNDTLANIIKALSTGDKKHCELEKVCGRASDGANKQAFYKISQTAEFKEKIAKKQVGKNVFYSLKTKAPDIYELTDD